MLVVCLPAVVCLLVWSVCGCICLLRLIWLVCCFFVAVCCCVVWVDGWLVIVICWRCGLFG